jgi:hypothetical protein
VMSEEAVNPMRVFITRTVVMKSECAAKVTSEEERRRQTSRACTYDDTVVRSINH